MEENIEIPLSEPDKEEEPSEAEPEVAKENGKAEEIVKTDETTEKIKDFETTIANLREELTKKTDVISNLEKQKASFEKEVTNVSRHDS
jgi:predicted RNase H-like nuclease (RuvC/YqgF family)